MLQKHKSVFFLFNDAKRCVRTATNKVPYVESQNHWQHKVLNIEYLSDKAHNKGNSRTPIVYSLVGQRSNVAKLHTRVQKYTCEGSVKEFAF